MERLTRNAPVLLLGAALVAAAVLTLALASEMTFYADTWELLMNRREPSADTLLQPHNEHLVAIPVVLQQLHLRIFGMTSAMPEYVVLTFFLLATAALVYVYVKRRVGPWLALFAAVLLLFLGPAWEVLLWPFEITFVGPILCGLAMLLALEREDRLGDLAACAFLVASLGFSGLGVPFIAAAAVAILQGKPGSRLRRSYVFAVPSVLFAVWYQGWGHAAGSNLSVDNVVAAPGFVADSVALAVGALFGFGTSLIGGGMEVAWRWTVLAVLVAAVCFSRLRSRGIPAAVWPVAAAAGANWLLTALNAVPGREPAASRYQYAGAVFVLLILANLLQDVRLGRRALWIAAAVTTAAVAANLVVLERGRDVLDQQALLTRSGTAAIEIARRTIDPTLQLNPELVGTPSLIDVFAGPYLEAVDEYGSPAYSPAELDRAPEQARRRVDVVLAQALPLSTVTTPGGFDARRGDERCLTLPPGDAVKREVPLTAGLTTIELAPGPPAKFSLRRFAASGYPVPTEGAPGGSSTRLRIPRDTVSRRWRLLVEAPQLARVCRSDRPS